MKKVYTVFVVLLLISCGVKESEKESAAEDKDIASSTAVTPHYSGTQPLFTKEDIIGVWTSGETENASFSIEEDSILFVDELEFVKYKFRNDTLMYIEDDAPFFQTRVIKADKDSLVLSNHDGTHRFWRFRD